MRNQTFAECFCAKYNIPREKYARAVFNRILYRRTHLVKWMITYIIPNYFAADFDLIYGVENLRRLREFIPEVDRFNDHIANHGWLRRAFCLRVSTGRLKALIRETIPSSGRSSGNTDSGLPTEEGSSAPPFEAKGTKVG